MCGAGVLLKTLLGLKKLYGVLTHLTVLLLLALFHHGVLRVQGLQVFKVFLLLLLHHHLLLRWVLLLRGNLLFKDWLLWYCILQIFYSLLQLCYFRLFGIEQQTHLLEGKALSFLCISDKILHPSHDFVFLTPLEIPLFPQCLKLSILHPGVVLHLVSEVLQRILRESGLELRDVEGKYISLLLHLEVYTELTILYIRRD